MVSISSWHVPGLKKKKKDCTSMKEENDYKSLPNEQKTKNKKIF